MPGGDPPGNHLERNRQAFGCCPAVDDDGEDRVLPQRGLPPAGVAEQIRLQAAPHASCGVQGVLAVAVFDASAERHLGQVLLPQPVVLERLGPRRTREIESRNGELQQSDVGGEPAGPGVGSRSASDRGRRCLAAVRPAPRPERGDGGRRRWCAPAVRERRVAAPGSIEALPPGPACTGASRRTFGGAWTGERATVARHGPAGATREQRPSLPQASAARSPSTLRLRSARAARASARETGRNRVLVPGDDWATVSRSALITVPTIA